MAKRIIGIYLVITILFLSACFKGDPAGQTEESGQDGSTQVQTTEDQNPPADGGTLTLSMRHPFTLNPLLNEDETVDRVLSLIFEKLYILDEEMKPQPNPSLLSGSAVSADGKTWTLTLRDGIQWADGTAITANDISFTIDYLKNTAPETAIYKEYIDNISSTQVTGQQARINLVQPYAQMGYMLRFPLIPQSYYRGVNTDNAKQMNPMGNGLFKLDTSTVAEITLTASENAPRGQAHINGVNVAITSSDEADVNAFVNGVTDALPASFSAWSEARAAFQDFRTAEYVSGYFDFIGFNFLSPAASLREVRAAAARCLDYANILQTVYKNTAALSPTPIFPESWLADRAVIHPAYNLDEARTLLESLPPELGPITLRVLVNQENAERVKVAEQLSENLEQIGITVDLRNLPWDAYMEAVTNGDFDIYLGGYKMSAVPDLSFMLHSQYAGATNHQRYADANMDKFLQDAYAARDEAAIIQAYSQLQNYIAYEMPVVGLVFRKSAVLVSDNVSGPLEARMDDVFFNIEAWYNN